MPDEPGAKPWLLGVARRVLANQRRGIRRRGELVKKLSASMAPRFEELVVPTGREDVFVVTEALKKLSKRDQELLLLTAWEELTPSEIALMLDLSSSVVRKRLFRARTRLIAAAGQFEADIDLGKLRSARPDSADGQDPSVLAVRKRATAW
jgi:RNA polymerase sigma-70 factor (ECF subfamily)